MEKHVTEILKKSTGIMKQQKLPFYQYPMTEQVHG